MLDGVMESVYEDMPDPVKIQKSRQESKKAEHEFQMLCYQVFMVNPDGKRLYELLKERFLVGLSVPYHNPDPNMALYFEGMREVVRGLYCRASEHRTRIQTPSTEDN